MRQAERFEDMSQHGRLQVMQQDDGDMIVCVIEDAESRGPCAGLMASVEFCTSGGKSPRTRAALRELMLAMAEDNADPRISGRRGERGWECIPTCRAPSERPIRRLAAGGRASKPRGVERRAMLGIVKVSGGAPTAEESAAAGPSARP